MKNNPEDGQEEEEEFQVEPCPGFRTRSGSKSRSSTVTKSALFRSANTSSPHFNSRSNSPFVGSAGGGSIPRSRASVNGDNESRSSFVSEHFDMNSNVDSGPGPSGANYSSVNYDNFVNGRHPSPLPFDEQWNECPTTADLPPPPVLNKIPGVDHLPKAFDREDVVESMDITPPVLERMNESVEDAANKSIQVFELDDGNSKSSINSKACDPEKGGVNDVSIVEDDNSQDSAKNCPESFLKSPLRVLIKAAKLVNPVQFSLPPDFAPSVNLPGIAPKDPNHGNKATKSSSSVGSYLCQPSTSSGPPQKNKRKDHELDTNGLVPLPVKTCYYCSRSCRKAPLIQCDYCTSLFHADCLDPPLLSLPSTGRWMCPLHVEHVLDAKLLETPNLSERIKLWDRFSRKINQDGIKVDFLNKCSRDGCRSVKKSGIFPKIKGMFRFQNLVPTTIKTPIPDAVKAMYRHPPDKTPIRFDYIGTPDGVISKVIKGELSADEYSKKCTATAQEQEHWLQSVIALQSSIADYLSARDIQGRKVKIERVDKVEEESDSSFTDTDLSVDAINDISLLSTDAVKDVGSSEPDGDVMVAETEKVEQAKKADETSDPRPEEVKPKEVSLSTPSSKEEDIMSKLDDKLIKALALQRLQQLISGSPEKKSNIREMTQNQENQNSSEIVPLNRIKSEKSSSTVKKISLGDVRARAVLCPVFVKYQNNVSTAQGVNNGLRGSTSGPAFAMSYRSLKIGTSVDNDVVLTNYGHCNFVSAFHCCIFYDEVIKITN